MVALLWVPLRLAGGPVETKEGVVMVWSGLRGAVSLAMAIIVDLEPEIPTRMGSRVMFHVGGLAALTTLLNAPTVSFLLRSLGLTKTPKMKAWILSQFKAQMTEGTRKLLDEDVRGSQ